MKAEWKKQNMAFDILSLLFPPVKEDIMIIDSTFPQEKPLGFRNSEINALLNAIPGAVSYAMRVMKPGKAAWFSHSYGTSEREFLKRKASFLKYHPENPGKIKYLRPRARYTANLAYSYFLAETYTLLPFLNKNRIPFVFVLYPGGAFGINNVSSDRMLGEIFVSPYFKKVIATQRLTMGYLTDKKLCPPDKIIYDPGISMQFTPADVRPKKFYGSSKKTFDICFVAAKYGPNGADKGYDIFIETALKAAAIHEDIMFHVVGGFTAADMDVSALSGRIKFYGYLLPDKLPDFYSGMDIFLSPNRPNMLYEGSFDGFPLSAGAMYCGVCGFNTDPLGMNTEFKPDEAVIIGTDPAEIAEKIGRFFADPKGLYDISEKGRIRAQKLYDLKKLVDGRIKIFSGITGLPEGKNGAKRRESVYRMHNIQP